MGQQNQKSTSVSKMDDVQKTDKNTNQLDEKFIKLYEEFKNDISHLSGYNLYKLENNKFRIDSDTHFFSCIFMKYVINLVANNGLYLNIDCRKDMLTISTTDIL